MLRTTSQTPHLRRHPHLSCYFFFSFGEDHDELFERITIPFVPWGPLGAPFFPATHSTASCIARRTVSRDDPSLSVSDVFALMTTLLDHTDLYGALPALARSDLLHKANKGALAPAAGKILLKWAIPMMAADNNTTLIARIVPGAVRECDVPLPPCSAFRLLPSLSTHALGHSQ